MDCMALAGLVQHHVPTLGQAPLEPGNRVEMLGLGLLCMVCREEGVFVNKTWSLWSRPYLTS